MQPVACYPYRSISVYVVLVIHYYLLCSTHYTRKWFLLVGMVMNSFINTWYSLCEHDVRSMVLSDQWIYEIRWHPLFSFFLLCGTYSLEQDSLCNGTCTVTLKLMVGRHTHTHAHAHARTRTHTHTHTCTCTCTRTHTHTHTRTYTHTHAHNTHAHISTQTLTLSILVC